MRIDTYLFEEGYYESREKAKKAIEQMRIFVNGKTVQKSSFDIKETDKLEIMQSGRTEYVGRGGIKLEHALDSFYIDVKGKRAIDIGASTGGFTDCLLKRGAEKVYAVDIGHGQLHPSIANDPRVVNLEGVNAREMTVELVENNPVDIAVSDLSFISQKLVIPKTANVICEGGIYIILIKPQFEAGREHIGKNGIVKDERVRKRVVSDILEFAKGCGYEIIGCTVSPITGGSGNIEYLTALKK